MISTTLEFVGLVLVLQIILNMSHLVVNRKEIVGVYVRAHLYSAKCCRNKHLACSVERTMRLADVDHYITPLIIIAIMTQTSSSITHNTKVPVISLIVEVPGGGMTDKRSAIDRLFKHRMLPEWRRHGRQAQGYEEIVSCSEHPVNCVILKPSVQRNMHYMLVHVHTCSYIYMYMYIHIYVHAWSNCLQYFHDYSELIH